MKWPKPPFLKAISPWQLPSPPGVAVIIHWQWEWGWLPFVRSALPPPSIIVSLPCGWPLFLPAESWGAKNPKCPGSKHSCTLMVPTVFSWCKGSHSTSPARIYCFLLDETISGVITIITYVISDFLTGILMPWNYFGMNYIYSLLLIHIQIVERNKWNNACKRDECRAWHKVGLSKYWIFIQIFPDDKLYL